MIPGAPAVVREAWRKQAELAVIEALIAAGRVRSTRIVRTGINDRDTDGMQLVIGRAGVVFGLVPEPHHGWPWRVQTEAGRVGTNLWLMRSALDTLQLRRA